MNLTIKEVSELVKGEAEGDPSARLNGLAPLESAGPTHLAYLSDLGRVKSLCGVKAGGILLPREAKGRELPFSGNRIYVSNPQWAFALVLRHMQLEMRPKPKWGIHPTAVVDPTAKIGKYTTVGPHCVLEKDSVVGDFSVLAANCYLGEKTVIGRNCMLYPQVVVREGCAIGNGVILHPGAVIGADGFGYVQVEGRHEKIPQIGTVVIEDDVEIGACSAVDRAMLGETRIGAGTKIDNLVQIAHNVKIGKNCVIVAQAGIAGSCSVGDGTVIAGQAGIGDHVNIGSRVIVTAQTGVMSDLADGSVVFGSPSRPHREAFKLQALYGRLPEIYEAVKEIKKHLKGRTPEPDR